MQGEGIAPNAGLCFRACTLHLVPGTYTVSFRAGSSMVSRSITVNAPSEVVIDTGGGFQRGLGLALIIGGGTVGFVGAGTLYADQDLSFHSAEDCSVDSTQCYRTPSWVLPVEIAGGIGFGTAVVGIVLFLTAQPSVKVSEPDVAASARASDALARLHVTPDVGANHAGLRLDWSF
ncbi:MAG TPA: hypothetical protein VMI54_05890 [Polyangiaceae bacterium]|nr:hypothetical protein [Polyangiaceae bacterium]